ncbi:MAG: hypothetical protein KDA90_16930 [Planctomycetaceae bacterium]|nr:hypothetical protein [Planctomycetaceae bacterium]
MYLRPRCAHQTGIIWVMICLLPVLSQGCGRGESGPQRYSLSGTVTYQGQPVPAGTILFQPDASAGNIGPGSLATIEDGKYQLSRSQGVVGGAYILELSGQRIQTLYDDDGEELPVEDLFPEQEMRVTLPEGGTLDISVPTDVASVN